MKKIDIGSVRILEKAGSLYIRIPRSAVHEMRLAKGDIMEITVSCDRKFLKYRLIPASIPDPVVMVEPDMLPPTLAEAKEPSVPVPEPHTEKTWLQRLSELLLWTGE